MIVFLLMMKQVRSPYQNLWIWNPYSTISILSHILHRNIKTKDQWIYNLRCLSLFFEVTHLYFTGHWRYYHLNEFLLIDSIRRLNGGRLVLKQLFWNSSLNSELKDVHKLIRKIFLKQNPEHRHHQELIREDFTLQPQQIFKQLSNYRQ